MEIVDLKYGNVLETEKGKKFLKTIDYFIRLDLVSPNTKEFYEDLTKNFILKDRLGSIEEVVKVYEDYTCQKVLWERRQLTNDEKTLLRCLPKEFKYLARDEDGNLWCFEAKPFKRETWWDYHLNNSDCYELDIFKHLFQFVKWEDDEPTSIEELLEMGD